MTASLHDYRWLTSDAAVPWLRLAADELARGMGLVAVIGRLRKELSAERSHLALLQVELRRKAREKFSRADQMYFTPLGLAQATDEPLARYKAARFAASEHVADLCCGIGGDLVALGAGRNCLGVDRDDVAAHLAVANAAVYGLENVTVVCREATAAVLSGCEAWHIDPDRRPEGKRTVRAERFEPPWEAIETLLARCGNGAVKLAPATKLDDDVVGRCEREWIESRGECRQQVAWFGELARDAGKCAATAIDVADGPATLVGIPGGAAAAAESVGRFVYEPCAAVRAAHLTGALCNHTGLAGLGGGAAYLTGEERIAHPLLAGFEVVQSLPFDRRRLKEALRTAGVGPLEVKKRGVDIQPDRWQRELTREEGEPGVVLVTPIGTKTTAIVARRMITPRP
jgi:hypothetical protein